MVLLAVLEVSSCQKLGKYFHNLLDNAVGGITVCPVYSGDIFFL